MKRKRVQPALQVPTNTGNMYTASAWVSLASLLYYVGSDNLKTKESVFSPMVLVWHLLYVCHCQR